MPKTVKVLVPAIFVVATLIAGPLLSLSSFAQPQGTVATNAGSRNAALIAATTEVLKETSEIRQLSILRPVQSSAQSRIQIESMIKKDLDDQTSPAEMYAVEVTMKKLGLAPSDFQYRPLMVRLLTEQVAGYYDPKTRQFHLADWIDLNGQRPVMAHELTHALQDQHFNLRRFEHWPKGDSDAELAAHSLIEGDATLVMALYVANNPMRALAFLKSLGATGMATEELDKAPRALRETLLFPYQEGTEWTRSLYKRGGWDQVSKAFTDLPQSTEQILHPEKYFAHEAPIKVTLPDITNLLNSGSRSRGAPPATRTQDSRVTWKRLAPDDVNGEWGFYLIVDQFLKSPAESRRATAGWGGDRFSVYEGPKGEVLMVSLSSWDTENDAREFYDAYVKRTERRYPGVPSVNDRSLSMFYQRWQTSEGIVTIDLRGKQVLVLEGLPKTANINAFLKILWPN